MNNDEHKLQCACVQWFNIQHRDLRGLLFAVPNGGARSKATAGKLKAEGVVPGVADLILLVPHLGFPHIIEGNADGMVSYVGTADLFCGLCIEMKTPKGRQSPEQKAWQSKVESHCYKYAVVRSLEDFIKQINDYLT